MISAAKCSVAMMHEKPQEHDQSRDSTRTTLPTLLSHDSCCCGRADHTLGKPELAGHEVAGDVPMPHVTCEQDVLRVAKETRGQLRASMRCGEYKGNQAGRKQNAWFRASMRGEESDSILDCKRQDSSDMCFMNTIKGLLRIFTHRQPRRRLLSHPSLARPRILSHPSMAKS